MLPGAPFDSARFFSRHFNFYSFCLTTFIVSPRAWDLQLRLLVVPDRHGSPGRESLPQCHAYKSLPCSLSPRRRSEPCRGWPTKPRQCTKKSAGGRNRGKRNIMWRGKCRGMFTWVPPPPPFHCLRLLRVVSIPGLAGYQILLPVTYLITSANNLSDLP